MVTDWMQIILQHFDSVRDFLHHQSEKMVFYSLEWENIVRDNFRKSLGTYTAMAMLQMQTIFFEKRH